MKIEDLTVSVTSTGASLPLSELALIEAHTDMVVIIPRDPSVREDIDRALKMACGPQLYWRFEGPARKARREYTPQT